MTETKHILLATDGSPSAERAFQRALELVVALKARLTILSVTELESGPGGQVEDTAKLKRELAGQVEEFCRAARDRGARRVEGIMDAGLPYSRILGLVERDDVDLLVMGANGWRSTPPDLGSVALHVAKFATCAVLVVR